MPEEREVAEALEHAVAAVESEPSGHALTEHARSVRSDKLKSTAAVLTALAALIAATGAFLKTLDHGVTESAYNTLSDSIVKLSDRQQKTTEDVAMLRGYLDGLSRTPMPVSAPTSASSASPSPIREPVTVTLTVVDAGAPASRDAGRVHTFVNLVPSQPPPAVAPPAPPVKPPSFAAAIAK